MSLYLFLDLASISLPFLFSFHPKIKFHQKWKQFWPSLMVISGIYLLWDVIFSYLGYWSFNQEYLVGISFLHLPIEEWLFFICIPYACVFTHYVIELNCKSWRIPQAMAVNISRLLLILFVLSIFFFYSKWYTVINSLVTGSILLITLMKRPEILKTFYISFFILLVPFLIVNGILTGSFIEGEVVAYNPDQHIGWRLFTIPVEDIFYAMGMILGTILLMEWKFAPK